jgi:hydrogenase maturation protein HypF
MAPSARRISVRGVVQGVGFRPFVYQLARLNRLTGWVRNTSGNVVIMVEGEPAQIDRFLEGLRIAPPPQSHIESISLEDEHTHGFQRFEIRESLVESGEYQLVSPDLATCPDCRKEIFNSSDRRYRYPFTNCTACGPRFTIIEGIPYDRERTTMKEFRMCANCQREYDDPSNRRFHAQPNACPVCGPSLTLAGRSGAKIESGDVIASAARLLQNGQVLAIKGLGGFLLACDATADGPVSRLRERKKRPAKPFALMVRDLEEAERLCYVNKQESALLGSPPAPIVLMRMRDKTPLSPLIAPGLDHLGLMLPYTPLHHLLMRETGLPLVMTSGNLSEEPIAAENAEALARLGGIADYFVMHNRRIHARYDDSVVTVEGTATQIVRRARGYAPYPVHLPFNSRQILACGAEVKNTFCLTRDGHAFVSQHIGDMENLETLEHFERTLGQYEKLFVVSPELIACDLHPDYLPTRWAETEAAKRNLPLVRVQHHHAHIAGCMAENGVQEEVIGVALDGTGLGTDGRLWGCEFLVAGYGGFERKAHLEYLPLPGGSAAIHRPSRTAIGYLYALLGNGSLNAALPPFKGMDEMEIDLIKQQIDQSLNAPLTSSCGRLFDAVSSLTGICQQVEYEGQAAIELEAAAGEREVEGLYPYRIENSNGVKIICVRELFTAIVADYIQKRPAAEISAIFHNTLTRVARQICRELAAETGIHKVALSGGVFQNRRLLRQVRAELKEEGLTPLCHLYLPANDGCISLGQAAVANFSNSR